MQMRMLINIFVVSEHIGCMDAYRFIKDGRQCAGIVDTQLGMDIESVVRWWVSRKRDAILNMYTSAITWSYAFRDWLGDM
jgi:hypothetical protein